MLGSGIRGLNVLELAKRIIARIEKIGIAKITIDDLKDMKGVGTTKALLVLSVLELGKRFGSERVEILSPEAVSNLCNDIRASQREHFVAFYLDSQNKLIERQVVSIGILDASLVHPREVFEPALLLHAASIIVAHNHPSGSLEASQDDREVSNRLIDVGKLLGIGLVDHIIVTKEGFMSFKQKNLL